jgi:L-ribulose-5-phosphate 3-epimerase UlaE
MIPLLLVGKNDSILSKWDWSVNDILVFSTVVIFVIVIISCVCMWVTHLRIPLKVEKERNVATSDTSRKKKPISRDFDRRTNKLTSEDMTRKKKKSNKKRPSGCRNDIESQNDDRSISASSVASSEYSTLLGGDDNFSTGLPLLSESSVLTGIKQVT